MYSVGNQRVLPVTLLLELPRSNEWGKGMQQGWYADSQEPTTVACFDGTVWGPETDRLSLTRDIQATISPLHPGHSGPRAPFETTATAVPHKPMPAGLGWLLGIGAGALLIFLGITNGFANAGANCGAPFKGNSIAEYMDALAQDSGIRGTTYAADCKESITSATVWVWALILIGVLVVLASAIIMAVLRSAQAPRAATPAPQAVRTPASQIEDLARLRDKGLVTPEEYERKKQELLRLF